MKWISRVAVILACVLLCSCNPQQRIARLALKYNLVHTDTIAVHDTCVVPAYDTCYIAAKADTINIHDTVHNIDYSIITKHDTIYLHVNKYADTLVNTVYVPVEKIVVKHKDNVMKYMLGILFVAAFIAVLVYCILNSNKNEG